MSSSAEGLELIRQMIRGADPEDTHSSLEAVGGALGLLGISSPDASSQRLHHHRIILEKYLQDFFQEDLISIYGVQRPVQVSRRFARSWHPGRSVTQPPCDRRMRSSSLMGLDR